jgi:predicted transposase/invertase (TIGR01784 family)
VELSDIREINTLELLKLPEGADGTELYDWAKFIAAETEEELYMIAERNPVVERAVTRLRELSADERARDLYERREKARRDQASREKWAAKQKAMEIARNALQMNLTIDDIIKLTGLTHEEIVNLQDTD